jgi:hypothetical protein
MARWPRVRTTLAVAIWGSVFAAAGLGCSSILGIEADRYLAASDASSESDVRATGDSSKPSDAQVDPWGCLGLPVPGAGTTSPLDITLIVMDGLQPEISAGQVDGGSDLVTVSGAYLPGITVQACALLDPGCSMPSGTHVTDDAGRAAFALDTSFQGFFGMSGKVSGQAGVPVTLYPGTFLPSDNGTSIPAYELSKDGLQILAGSLVQTPLALGPDAGAGHLLVNIYDCQDHQAAGVEFAYSNLGSQAQPFYMKGGIPSPMSTQTDDFGLGGAINIPTGAQTVTATLAGEGTVIGSQTVLVRPGQITWAWVRVRSQ